MIAFKITETKSAADKNIIDPTLASKLKIINAKGEKPATEAATMDGTDDYWHKTFGLTKGYTFRNLDGLN